MSESDTFEQLLNSAKSGEHAALQQLLYAQYDYLDGIVRSQIGPNDGLGLDREDILQEAFIHVIRDIGNCNAECEKSYRGWLRSVTQNRIRDAIKHRRRKKRDGKIAADIQSENGSRLNLVEILPGELETPSVHAATLEATRTLDVWLATLPEEQKTAVTLRYTQRLSAEEIAEEMGKSVGAVRGLLFRAKKRLRELMGRSSMWLSKK